MGLPISSVDVDVFATACCDLDLWPPESNQVISGASEYATSVLSKIFKPFVTYGVHKI